VLQVWPYNSSQDVGDTIQFPDTAVGAVSQLQFLIVNTGSAAITITTFRIPPGGAFSIYENLFLPWTLEGGQFSAVGFQFAPTASGPQSATLSLNDRTITVQGNGTGSASAAQPSLAMDNSTPGSNASVKVSVTFAQAATAQLAGLLKLQFTPANASLPTDPGIYLDGNQQQTLVQPFLVPAGTSTAQFGSASYVTLHTGTSAGNFVLTAMTGSVSDQISFSIAPAAPVITSNILTMSDDNAQIVMQGFDNTHAVTGLTFTFYTASGSVVSPGALSVDVTNSFSQYYAANPQIGGSFQITANCPVTGDVSQVHSVAVSVKNATGTTTSTSP
jgi:hypothetical protein